MQSRSSDQVAVSVSNASQVLVVGDAQDLGRCKAKRKDGKPCNAVING